MTTAPATDPLAAGLAAELPIDQIAPHPDNPRRIDDKHPSLEGLAQSIRETGLINPITVRARNAGPDDDQRFEILAGERRWRAARKAGLRTIAVRILKVTEEQAFHILAVENLQREDLHWLEEARGVEAMVKKGWDAATIARHVGRSEQWVRLRSKLAGIAPAWRKEVEDPEGDFHGWPAAMLELVARFPLPTQEAILKEGGWDLAHCKTAAELREVLDRDFLRALKAAPWSLDDAKLVPKAGACSACPKRSSCQQQLFAEAKDDRCLDAACWKAKGQAQLTAAVDAARKEHPKAILVGESHEVPEQLAKQVKAAWQYREAKPGAKGAVPAVFVSGDKAGTVGYVVKGSGYASSSDSVTRSKPAKAKATPKEQLAAFMLTRHRAAVGIVIQRLGGKRDGQAYQKLAPAPLVSQPPRHVLIALAATIGIEGRESTWDWRPKTLAQLREMTDQGLDLVLWDSLRVTLVASLAHHLRDDKPSDRPQAIAELCGLDWKTIVGVARDETPLPKALAALFDQDGKPLRALTAKAKASPPAKPKAKAAAAKR